MPSLGGSRYFATYLDDFSKVSVVQPIARKSDVAAMTRDVLAQLERLSGCLVGTVRTDGGGEYISYALEAYFTAKGIRHQLTVRYTPQQNGKAERLNRTLMERVRAMLADSQMEKQLWAEALVTANYIRNRSPAAGAAKTPWELFHGRKPDVSQLRAFGATAYIQVPDQLRRKLDSKAQRGVMIGYAVNTKGYRVLMPDGQIRISRDVIFDESAPAARALELSTAQEPSKAAGLDAVGAEGSQSRQQAREQLESSEAEESVGAGAEDEEELEQAPPHSQPTAGQRYPTRQRNQPTEWWRGQPGFSHGSHRAQQRRGSTGQRARSRVEGSNGRGDGLSPLQPHMGPGGPPSRREDHPSQVGLQDQAQHNRQHRALQSPPGSQGLHAAGGSRL